MDLYDLYCRLGVLSELLGRLGSEVKGIKKMVDIAIIDKEARDKADRDAISYNGD